MDFISADGDVSMDKIEIRTRKFSHLLIDFTWYEIENWIFSSLVLDLLDKSKRKLNVKNQMFGKLWKNAIIKIALENSQKSHDICEKLWKFLLIFLLVNMMEIVTSQMFDYFLIAEFKSVESFRISDIGLIQAEIEVHRTWMKFKWKK